MNHSTSGGLYRPIIRARITGSYPLRGGRVVIALTGEAPDGDPHNQMPTALKSAEHALMAELYAMQGRDNWTIDRLLNGVTITIGDGDSINGAQRAAERACLELGFFSLGGDDEVGRLTGERDRLTRLIARAQADRRHVMYELGGAVRRARTAGVKPEDVS